jgi:organic radical activating enzyme
MSKIKISEIFFSCQGEARYLGVPSIFLRTFGCNFRCPAFGLPHGEKTTEVDTIIRNIGDYKTYNDLPLVASGCDSYAAVYPEFKHLSPMMDINDLVHKIMELLPRRRWEDEHLVITGGEPLLGWQRSYPDLLEHPSMHGLKEITFETNGTQKLSPEFASYLHKWKSHHDFNFFREVTFSVSAKLSNSGESRTDAIRPDVVCEYEEYGTTYLKFVVATDTDVAEALEVTELYRAAGFGGHVYLMPVGGVESVYNLNTRQVAELAMRHGLRYSPRLQVDLFSNAWGT